MFRTMMTRGASLVLLLAVLAGPSVVAASPPVSGAAEPQRVAAGDARDAVMVTDMDGRRVTIPPPQSIARVAIQTSPQVLEAYAIGIQDRLCAVTNAVKMWKTLTRLDPHLASVPATRSTNAQVNIEALLQTHPDVCLGGDVDMQVIEQATALPTLHVSQARPGGYLEQLKKEVSFFGLVFGREARAQAYGAYLDTLQAVIKAATGDLPATRRVKVFMGYDADHLTTYGGNTFMNEWIDAAGCVNAARDISSLGGREGGLTSISMEQVLSWNPDIVVIDSGDPDALKKDPVWSTLSAVKNNRVYRLPVGIFIWNRPSCESAAMLPEWLALTAYPSRFGNIDIGSEIKRFYQEIFHFAFTDEDVRRILKPE
jgi:iron complex transport system substrate-binding protein